MAFTLGHPKLDKTVFSEYEPQSLMKISDDGMVFIAKTKKGELKVIKVVKTSDKANNTAALLELKIQMDMAEVCPETILPVERSYKEGSTYVMVMEHWGFPFMPSHLREWDDVDLGSKATAALGKASMNDLFGYIECYGKMTESKAIRIMYKVVSTISVLHSMNYEYNDLKDENILLDETLDHIKLIDFGSAMPDTSESRKMFLGTLAHAPPEVFQANFKRKSKGQDVWCIGRLLYLMVTGREYLTGKDIVMRLGSGSGSSEMVLEAQDKLLENVSESVRIFIRGCLEIDPEQRYTMEDVLGSDMWTRISNIT